MSPGTPAWRQTPGRVLAQADAGAGHRWLDLELEPPFTSPRPGQFVQLLLPSPSNPALLPRPMSVARVARTRNGLRLGFLYAPVGLATRALAALGAGGRVEVLGPLGRGFPLDHAGTPVLVAGGRGVAPLLFAADALARGAGLRQGRRRCEFLFGARDREHLIGLPDARRRLEAAGGRLHLCTEDGSRGSAGTVVDLLARVARRLEPPLVLHACGPHAMLKGLARWALARGVPAFVAMESMMACGTGVCRGCPLPRSASARAAFDEAATPSLRGNREWALCCTEGPVFEVGALDWGRIE